MKKYNVIFLFSILIFISCNSRKKQEKQADIQLNRIEQLIFNNKLNDAKKAIDSIHLLYPKLINKRRIAASLEDTIVIRESDRTLNYYQPILPKLLLKLDSIQKNFRYEKDEKYQQFGNYIYKTQRTESNTDRNYLKAYVDENCDFYLISNYSGSKLDHSSVEVSANNSFASTDTILVSTSANHSFNNGEIRWETVTFKNEAGSRIAAFVTQYSNLRIKVNLKGKKVFSYYLSESDKNAISASYQLWIVKKDVLKIQKEIKKAKLKIERKSKTTLL